MKIGVPKEILNNENRVAMTPPGVSMMVQKGHEVWVEKGAGIGSGFSDTFYEEMGAVIKETPEEVWAADLVLKIKEPTRDEYQFFREGLILFTYLHLAASVELTDQLLTNKVTAIGYETVQPSEGVLPLLMPMSEVAGRMAVQLGARYLEKQSGGKGILLGAVPGVNKGNVVVIGGGVVGSNAARMALGLGANVTLLDMNQQRLTELSERFGSELQTLMSNSYNLEKVLPQADLVIGAVLLPGGRAPTLVSEEMVKSMEPGTVVVDIAVDQGGIFETTTHSTDHSNPTYERHGVIHYAVPNMPGAVPKTSTAALTNVTLPYIDAIVTQGISQALKNDSSLATGVNTYQGHLTNEAVAKAQDKSYTALSELM